MLYTARSAETHAFVLMELALITTEHQTPTSLAGLTWHEHGYARRPGGPVWREPDTLLHLVVLLPFFGVLLAFLGLVSWMLYRDYLVPGTEGGNPTLFFGLGLILFILALLGTSTARQMRQRWLQTVSPDMLRNNANDSDDLDRRLSDLLDEGEQVVWARRLSAAGRLAGGAELLTSLRAVQLIGTHVISIPWDRASRVSFSYGRGNTCSLSVVGPPAHGYARAEPEQIAFGGCRNGSAVATALRYVLAPARPGVPMAGSTPPTAWAASLGRVLAEGERAVWTGRPQRSYLLAVIDRLAGLRNASRFIPVLVLSLIVVFVAPSILLEYLDGVQMPLFEQIWALCLAAVLLFVARPTDRATLYVLTDRRALQVRKRYLTGHVEVESYPQLDRDLFRVQQPRLAALLPGGSNLVLGIERRTNEQVEIVFRDLPELEAVRALSLLQGLYGAEPGAHRYEPGRMPVVSWEQRLDPQPLARIKAMLGKGEQVLWAGQARVTDIEQPLSLRAYVLTDRRAIVSATESFGRANISLSWHEIRRVKIEQHTNGRGTLTLAAPPSRAGLDERKCVFRDCPEIGLVRQLVERQLLGEATAGAMGGAEFEGVRESALGTQVPEPWRSEVAGTLLHGERARWIGRGDARTITAIWRQGLVVGLVIAIIVGVIAFFARNNALLGGTIVVAGLMAWGIQVMIRRMCNLAYVVTDRRALQVGGLGIGGWRSIEFYPGVERARIWSSIDAVYDQLRASGPGCADVHVSDQDAGKERRTALVTFVAVPRNEVAQVSELLGIAYGVPDELCEHSADTLGQHVDTALADLPAGEETGAVPVELALGHWPSWRWAVLSGLILAFSAAMALLALWAGFPWPVVVLCALIALFSGTQLWRHGIVLLRGLSSAVTLNRVPLSPGQRTRATVSVRGHAALAPLRVILVCRGRVHDRTSVSERVLHEQVLAEVDRLDLRPGAAWQQALAVQIPADAPRSRAPESNLVVRREHWKNGYREQETFRRVRVGNKNHLKKLAFDEPDFEWVVWTIEVQANGGWGARWIAFTHSYPFVVE